MKKIVISGAIIVLIIVLGIFLFRKTDSKEKITIRVGYQTQCAQIWSALVIKNQQLIERNIREEFPDKEVEVIWEDSPSGPPITNNMIAGKTQIGFMGDMPLLVNASKGQSHPQYRSVLLSMDGKGIRGKNQSIMIKKGEEEVSIESLRGKSVSVPFGSSAHRMLLAILEKHNLVDAVEITNQDVSTGLISIETDKITAHSTWEPYPAYMIHRGKSAKLVDGSESNIDYLDGIVADRNWAEAHPEYATAVVRAVLQAHAFIQANPEKAAEIFHEESSFPLEVTRQLVKSIHWDAYVYDQDIQTLKDDAVFLTSLKKIEKLSVESFWDDSYLKEATKKEKGTYPEKDALVAGWHGNVSNP